MSDNCLLLSRRDARDAVEKYSENLIAVEEMIQIAKQDNTHLLAVLKAAELKYVDLLVRAINANVLES